MAEIDERNWPYVQGDNQINVGNRGGLEWTEDGGQIGWCGGCNQGGEYLVEIREEGQYFF